MAARAASDASVQATRAMRDLRCVMLFTSSRCGGLEEASLLGCNAQYRTNRQTIPAGTAGRMRLAAATDRERNL